MPAFRFSMNEKSMVERREYIRLPFRKPFEYKVCKEEIINSLLKGYTRNISQSGLRCSLDKEVPLKSTVWLRLDLSSLDICKKIENRSVVLQSGILGKVVWEKHQDDGTFEIGIKFLTKEEKKSDIDKWQKSI